MVNLFLANNPYATGVKKAGQRAGGPLPRARYKLHIHEKHADYIRLIPLLEGSKLLGERAGFLIHGHGPRGSDGCIVPNDFTVVKLIRKLVKAREDAGKPAPTLEVISVGDLDRFEKLNALA